MQLILKNISSIQHAEIAFNGLTVIAGENDTGKSTAGKLLFAIVKAFNRYEEDLSEDKKVGILERVENIYLQIRKSYRFANNPALKAGFHPPVFFQEIFKSAGFGTVSRARTEYRRHELEILFAAKLELLNNVQPVSESKTIAENIESLKKLLLDFLEGGEEESVITASLSKALLSEFNFEITPKNTDLQSTVNLSEGDNKIFDIEIDQDKIVRLKIYDELFFDDATFIETPIVLQLYELLHSSGDLLEANGANYKKRGMYRPDNPYHLTDLIAKLKNVQYVSDRLLDENEPLFGLVRDIAQIMRGDFVFDQTDKDFIFRRGGGHPDKC